MSLRVEHYEVASSAAWDELWQACPYATYFQGREWAEVWSAYKQGRAVPSPVKLVFSDGLSAVVPATREKKLGGLVARQLLSPAGTFGGWLAREHLPAAHQALLFSFVDQTADGYVWRLNPYEPIYTELPGNVTEDVTQALDLSGGSSSVLNRWNKGSARSARKAAREGVEIGVADNQQDWVEYFTVYESSLKRWGKSASSVYSWRLFELMHQRDSSRIRLWLARHEGRIIAGALCFYASFHVAYWHGAALKEYFKLRPVNLLMLHVIRHAVENGYHWFDFNPSGGIQGVERFKRSLGAEPIPSLVIKNRSALPGLLAGRARRCRA